MSSPCAVHVALPRIPAHVRVIRHGVALVNLPSRGGGQKLYLEWGDHIAVSPPARLSFSYDGNRYRVDHGRVRLDCRVLPLGAGGRGGRATVLAVYLRSGRVAVRSGSRARRALVLGPELLARAIESGAHFAVERNPALRRTRAWTYDEPILAARAADPGLRVRTRITYAAISDANGLRLDVWPFSLTRAQRPPTRSDRLGRFWDDGRQCSVDCRAPAAIAGWPLRPFHQQHAIRAGLNELRPANFHIGVDVQAANNQAVYPLQSGFAHVFKPGDPDEHVQVGQFQYWHIAHRIHDGQYAIAYRTELGQVKYDFRHVHVSELGPAGQYLNPLRPGRTLAPYHDTEPPVIGIPRVEADGRVIVRAFDPQSFVQRGAYETPVLAPAALAWRLYDVRGRALTSLQWALRGSQSYSPALRRVVYAPGARNPGYGCFAHRHRCIPRWTYWLAGGLTAPLPLGVLARGRYRLSVYAWDWAGNTAALDASLSLPLGRHAAPAISPHQPLQAVFDYQ